MRRSAYITIASLFFVAGPVFGQKDGDSVGTAFPGVTWADLNHDGRLDGVRDQDIVLAGTTAGVLIMGVTPFSAASRLGLDAGQIILRVDNQKVVAPIEVVGAIDAARRAGRNSVLLLIQPHSGPLIGAALPLSFTQSSIRRANESAAVFELEHALDDARKLSH
jgi:S1-C subfamily serine protease